MAKFSATDKFMLALGVEAEKAGLTPDQVLGQQTIETVKQMVIMAMTKLANK